MESEKKRVFIIGNGFDLDLGWNTKYSDFANSKDWPLDDNFKNLDNYLNKIKSAEKWFDLEQSLKNYTEDTSVHHLFPAEDNKRYNDLCNALAIYLRKEQTKSIDVSSVAAQVFRSYLNYTECKYFTFNYTDLNSVAGRLGGSVSPTYVHGSLNGDIILGFDKTGKTQYKYMCKSYHSNYESSGIVKALDEADDIVFFGLCFGDIDFIYFKRFFDSLAANPSDKSISIFTRDNNSIFAIDSQIDKVTNDKLFDIKNNCDFKYYKTDGTDEDKILSLLNLNQFNKLLNPKI